MNKSLVDKVKIIFLVIIGGFKEAYRCYRRIQAQYDLMEHWAKEREIKSKSKLNEVVRQGIYNKNGKAVEEGIMAEKKCYNCTYFTSGGILITSLDRQYYGIGRIDVIYGLCSKNTDINHIIKKYPFFNAVLVQETYGCPQFE